MNKRFLLACLWGMMMACGVSAQSVLTPATKMLIAKQNIERQQMAKSMVPVKEKKVMTTILIEKDSDVSNEDLEAKGLEILKRRGTVVFAYVPVSRLEALAEVKGIRMVDTGESVEMKNDLSREASSVVMVHNTKVEQSNADEPLMYRGKGVDVGVIDLEFDLGHPAFRDANGKTRIKHATIYLRNQDGSPVFDETETPIQKTFDESNMEEAIELSDRDAEVSHGTHVAGIAAGSTDVLPDDDPAKKFYGMAPESNLLLSEPAERTSVALLHSFSEILDKADADKRPVVVNMSQGDNTARLDGSDPFNETLKELYSQYDMHGKIFCVSAGNEGYTNMPISAQMDCNVPIKDGNWTAQKKLGWMPMPQNDPDSPEKYVFIADNKVSFYSKDERTFGVEFIMMNVETRDTIATTGILTPEKIAELGNKGFFMEDKTSTGANYSMGVAPVAEMTKTNRYLLETDINFSCESQYGVIAIIYTKDEGMHVDATISKNEVWFLAGLGELAAVPNNHGSMNPWAVTDNVISVGSYNTRKNSDNVIIGPDGQKQEFVIGAISNFSSCLGPEYGNIRPDVVAPGAYIISAYHHRIINQNSITNKSTYNGFDYLWGKMEGTSMATPAVSGIVALWLQADPTLTVADVREIIKKTSDYDEFCKAEPYKSGYGKINAKKGLDYILSSTGIKTINVESQRPAKRLDSNGHIVIEKDGRMYNVVGSPLG